jgi:lysyl-tRNA synthetase class 2
MNSPARVPLRAAMARLAAGFAAVRVAGRLVRLEERLWLVDASGDAPLEREAGLAAGDIVSGSLVAAGERFDLLDPAILVRRTAPPTPAALALAGRIPVLSSRARIVDAVRAFFRARGFVEVQTPARVVCPGLEPHLVAIGSGPGRWLITSPELHLKRLLAAGVERVFEIARVWRGEEQGDWHLGEFSMLEWYRTYAGLDEIANDVAELLPAAARAVDVDPADVPGCDLSAPLERLTVREAVRRHTGLDLAALREPAALAAALDGLGIAHASGEGWDDLFFRLFLDRVEPHLGRGRPTILAEYPASQAALANVRNDPEWPVALRFEVYAAGVELANAFDELTDPVEQRLRHEADRAWRLAHGREAPPLDEEFLGALAAGHPPAAGIALGLDRLVALVSGLSSLTEVVAFPDGQ